MKKAKASNSNDYSGVERTSTTPSEAPLYFFNKGLFSDPFLQDHLPELENEAKSASNSFLKEHWQIEGTAEFSAAFETIDELWKKYETLMDGWSEAQLEEHFIKKVLKVLGWEFEVQDRLKRKGKTQIPDYSLFDSEKTYIKAKSLENNQAYFKQVLAVADAKAFDIDLDGIGNTNANPSYQIARYLEDTEKRWGILTNGKYWRIYSTRPTSKYTTFYEINLDAILSSHDEEKFKYFFCFFRKEAFSIDKGSDQNFLDVVYEKGKYYASRVEDDLKIRLYRVVENIAKGYAHQKSELSKDELRLIYENSLYFLFRLMFVLNCESKGLLSVDQQENYFDSSLRKLCIDLRTQYLEKKVWSDQPRTYNQILGLFDLLRKGDSRIEVQKFGDEIFSGETKKFFSNNSIPDRYLNAGLIELACDLNEADLPFIDYKRLSADHLGSLFEGLLEYALEYADQKLAVENGSATPWDKVAEKKKFQLKRNIVNKGELYLSNCSSERKDTGSYYTNESIVRHIVDETITPLCADKTANEILRLKVCDPAMGSGHFLLGVLRFLEEKVLDSVENDEASLGFPFEDLRLKIVGNCIFGVDLNPTAVELSKFSLWMYSANRFSELEPMHGHIKRGDSLVESRKDYAQNFVWKNEFKAIMNNGGFDAIVGNPPYGAAVDHDYLSTQFKLIDKRLSNTYAYFLEKAPTLLKTNGRLGFIVPNTWLSIDSCEDLRKFYFSTVRTDELTLTYQVFKDTTGGSVPVVDTVIVILENAGPAKDHEIVVNELDQKSSIEDRWKQIANQNWTKESKRPINEIKKQEGMKFLPGKSISKVEAGSSYVLEADQNPRFLVRIGAQEYAVGKGEPKLTQKQVKDRIYHSKNRTDRSYMPFVPCGDVQRFQLRWSKTYLKWGDNLHCPREKGIYQSEHLVVSRIFDKKAGRLKSAFVEKGSSDRFFVNNTDSFNIVRASDKDISLKFLLGIMNSKYVGDYLQSTNINLARAVYPKINVKDLKRIPIPEVTQKQQSDVIEMVEKIESLMLVEKRSHEEEEELGLLQKELDEAVEAIYQSKFKKSKSA